MTTQSIKRPLERIFPPLGGALTMKDIRGNLWHPSGSVAGAGIFAVRSTDGVTDFWAALHDFTAADQLRLIESCRAQDRGARGVFTSGRGGTD